ncbi:MAG: iron donor protein CyaY [Paludibacterium sp.]|uniref:iron donor protein CyaY n=1 Tax=Paludibacterium sp. TaxID=1917523 RepID=UPI0025EC1053|nr:iron donor protein CyaY [Paludibacterium sp.]MBV8046504.1 iron donor protein CyaY [Paludibacterium sp.]MBV8648004.1 iron donor protein CyaY [Paludibacterium sp.]
MTESEFLDLTDALLYSLQAALDDSALDLDYELNGGVLEIEFDSGEKMIINRHAPNQEMWVAAKSGGFHFKLTPQGTWINARDGGELGATLSALIARSSGGAFSWQAG